MKSNKFNIHWQVVRTKAKKIKQVQDKIKLVLSFLYANKNIHNFDRVSNWLQTTGFAYKDESKLEFELALNELKSNKCEYFNEIDSDNDFSKYSIIDLKAVLADLSKRKYDFQFNSVPKDHTQFASDLLNYLNGKEIKH